MLRALPREQGKPHPRTLKRSDEILGDRKAPRRASFAAGFFTGGMLFLGCLPVNPCHGGTSDAFILKLLKSAQGFPRFCRARPVFLELPSLSLNGTAASEASPRKGRIEECVESATLWTQHPPHFLPGLWKGPKFGLQRRQGVVRLFLEGRFRSCQHVGLRGLVQRNCAALSHTCKTEQISSWREISLGSEALPSAHLVLVSRARMEHALCAGLAIHRSLMSNGDLTHGTFENTRA
ncbi:unnamed protein product [Symbiodinium sp. CCMP2592]|nr:unnamed protein product [Symbiodinium sp. CCMP2592]